MERLRHLPARQLEEVVNFIDFILERGKRETAFCRADEAKLSILELRGRGKGERLIEKLLRSRCEDKALDG